MARENKTMYAILGSLTIRAMSAYDMKLFMKGSTNHFWAESDGQLYPTLKKCLEQQLVSCHEEDAANHGIRKIYSISEQGKQRLMEWLQSVTKNAISRNEHLLKLFYGANIDPHINLDRLKTFLRDAINECEVYELIKKNMKQDKRNTMYWMMTLDYGLKIVKAQIDWAKHSMEILQEFIQTDNKGG